MNGAHELHVKCLCLPLVMTIRFLAKGGVIPPTPALLTMMPCVSAGTSPALIVLNRRKSSRHVATMIAVRLVGNVMILTNVDGVTVIPAVVSVIAERLHPNPLALIDIVGSYASPIHPSFDNLEIIRTCFRTVFRLKVSRKSL